MEGLVVLLLIGGMVGFVMMKKKSAPKKSAKPRLSVTTAVEKVSRPKKDASFEFPVLGKTCRVEYYSDYRYLTNINDPEEFHYDPRRWVDVYFDGEKYGYAWHEGYWTQEAQGLEDLNQIEFMICQQLGTLCRKVTPGEIQTSKRQSFDGKYLVHGRTDDLLVAAEFKHGGYVVSLDVNGHKGRFDARSGSITLGARHKPAERAICEWIAMEYGLLKPLKGALPSEEIGSALTLE